MRSAFALTGGPERVLDTPPQGVPMFVRLPPQPAGNHSLTVEAHRSPNLDHAVSTPPAKGFARLAVREPEPWILGIASHAGLIVTTDPYDASLDIFWRNELNLSVTGPKDFAVSLHVSLHAADARKILSEPVSPPMDLPITPDAWRRAFSKFVENENRAWKYLEAATCTLEIKGESLGTYSHTFDHAPSPLRWVMNSQKRQTIIRLVDDTGLHDTIPEVKFYNMEYPLDATRLDPESARAGLTVPPPGGLFLARLSSFSDAAVVSAPPRRPGLQDLGVVPDVHVSPEPQRRCGTHSNCYVFGTTPGKRAFSRISSIAKSCVASPTRSSPRCAARPGSRPRRPMSRSQPPELPFNRSRREWTNAPNLAANCANTHSPAIPRPPPRPA